MNAEGEPDDFVTAVTTVATTLVNARESRSVAAVATPWVSHPQTRRPAARSASATMVSVGPYPVEVGNTDESVTSTFSTSQSRWSGPQTLARGSVPMRAVPMTCREIGVGA